MSHAFKEYLIDFLKVYMDDLCIHSGKRDQHIGHLRLALKNYRAYRIFLNPKVSFLNNLMILTG